MRGKGSDLCGLTLRLNVKGYKEPATASATKYYIHLMKRL